MSDFFGDALVADVNDLVDIWEEAELRIRLLVRDPELLGAGSIGVAEQRAQEIVREVTAELELLRQRTIEWAGVNVSPHVAQGTAAALATVAAEGRVAGGGLGVANTQAIRVITDDILADMEFSINSTQRTVRRSLRATQQTLVTEAAINEALIISESRLENANRRSKRLQNLFEKNSLDGKFINVNGRFFRLRTYADIIARTRLTEAAVEGALQATLAMGIDTVRISDHGPTDQFCDPFAGKVFSISGRDARFPRLQRRPPFHPNCKHMLLPFVPELQETAELDAMITRSNTEERVILTAEEFDRAGA